MGSAPERCGVRGTLTDDLSTEVLRLLARKRGSKTAGDDIHENWLGCERCNGVLEQLGGLHALNEAHIGARVGGELKAEDRLVHAQYLCGVGAANDHLCSRDQVQALTVG